MTTKLKLPKTLGACADLYGETREKRLALQKQVDAIEAEETAIREHILRTLPKADGGAFGRKFTVERIEKIVPKVEDWDKFYAHVRKTGDFDLLYRRLNDKAVVERWDDRKQVPGIGTFNVVALSLPRKV